MAVSNVLGLTLEQKIEIANNYCLNSNGCPKLEGIEEPAERSKRCASCNNYLLKIDLVEVAMYYKGLNATTPSPTSTRSTSGKGTELNKTQIEKVLLLHSEGLSNNKIAIELNIQNRTVKNVINQSFKNEKTNKKIEIIRNKMIEEGLL